MRIESFNAEAMPQLTGSTRTPKSDTTRPEALPRSEARSLDTVELSGRTLADRVVGGRGTPIFDSGDERANGRSHHKNHSVDRGHSIDRHHHDHGHKYGHNKVKLEETIQVGDAELNLKFKGPVNERSAINMVRKLHHQVDRFIEKNGIDADTSDAVHELIGDFAGEVFGAVYAEHGDRAALKDAFQTAFGTLAEKLSALFNPEPVDETTEEQTAEVSLTERELETAEIGTTSSQTGVVGSLSGGEDLLGSGETITTGGTTGSTGQLGSGLLVDLTA